MSTTVPSADAKAVVRAIEGLSTQLRRAVDAYLTPVVEVAEATDDAPPTAVAEGREPSYAAVYAYIRQLGDVMPTSRIDRNAIIWHAVNAALDATPTPTAPATTCSAQHHSLDDGRLCIRAAQHHGDHIDERGFHWSDTVAVYPVADSTVRIAHWRPVSDQAAEERRELAGVLDAFIDAQMQQAPAADEDAPNLLHVLVDRAARGVLSLPGEGEALRRRAEQLIAGRATWKRKAEEIERDRDDLAARNSELRELLGRENKRADEAIDREEAAEQAAEEQRQRARIFETELHVLRSGLRANGADPTQIQNLWAQTRLRTRQWRDAKRELEQAQAAIERVRAYLASQTAPFPKGYTVAVAAADVLAALDGAEQPTTEA